MSEPPSGTGTPRSFTSQGASAEDLLKSSTVGLVNLSDFRKRRAEVLEQKIKEAQDATVGRFKSSTSESATPGQVADEDDGSPATLDKASQPPKKKKKKPMKKSVLSFGEDEEDNESTSMPKSATTTPNDVESFSPQSRLSRNGTASPISRGITPNPRASLPAPKVITKASLQAEALQRDALRKEFLAMQEIIKNTDILIPFVFYDGTNIPGGVVKVKKGDHVWLFLERARKVGADTGAAGSGAGTTAGTGGGGSKTKNENKREWARVSVDDLICVRGEVIVPHHYEFYYFIANRVSNPSSQGGLLFDYANVAPKEGSEPLLKTQDDEELEGRDADPALTKVVDRRWYERNKHIYPASMWREFEPGKEFEEKMAKTRRDGGGNPFFFSH